MADQVPNIDVTVDKANYREGLLIVLETVRPKWINDDIKIEPLQQGFINLMVVCKVNEDKDDWVVARIFGTTLDLFMQDREREFRNTKLMAEIGVGPQVFASFNNGFIIKFVKGKTFSWMELSPFRDIKLLKAVVRQIAKIHCKSTLKTAVEKYNAAHGKGMENFVEEFMKNWPDVVVDEETTKWYNSQIPPKEERMKEMTMLMDHFMNVRLLSDRCLCHNDCNPTNIIYDEENDHVTLVDFEMTGVGLPLHDVTNFLNSSATGFAPEPEGLLHKPEVVREVYRTYLEEKNRLDDVTVDVTEEEVDELREITYAVAVAGSFLFQMVAALLSNNPASPVDPKMFLSLSIARMNGHYRRNREKMLKIFEKYRKVPESD